MMNPFDNRKTKYLSPAQVKQKLEDGAKFYLIDVRNPDEYAKGHIRGSTLLPLDTLRANIGKTCAQKNDEIVVYCHSGMRAERAVSILQGMGYTNVWSMGGIIDWPYAVAKGMES